ncbi:MAG: FMN-binding glutamate synthase family protein [Clostridia bacterium]|nr:FMN-binding glutamate synthase family protein [Clostridia bacterium]
MSLMQNFYSRITDNLLDKLTDMKMVKAPMLVDNYSFIKLMGIAERAKTGKPLSQPLGSTNDFKDFQELMLIPNLFPLEDNNDIDTQVVIGNQAQKPMTLPVPFMVAGMAYGASISMKAKIALAKAAASIQTATNSGEAGYIQQEREISCLYVVQYNRAQWGNSEEELKKADMIEIKMGQGASAGDGFKVPYQMIDQDFREHIKIDKEQDAVMPARFPDINTADDLKNKVDYLRQISEGVPIAVKIAAGNIEADIDILLYAGVDAIVIDGAQGETANSAEITINNFGIPTLHALIRADEYLNQKNARDKVSLIITGGIRDSGDMLKAMAMGADAFYIGYPLTIASIYTQLANLPAGSSPVDIYLYEGKHKNLLDVEEAANCTANYLKALKEEINIGLRCLGKNSIANLNKNDLVALTKDMAEITGVKLAYNMHKIN